MVLEEKYEGEKSSNARNGFHYEDKRMAEKCENHCRDYDACDTEIVENSLERKK